MKRFSFIAQSSLLGLLIIGFFGFGFRLMKFAEAAQEERSACNSEAFILVMEEVLEAFPDPNPSPYIDLSDKLLLNPDNGVYSVAFPKNVLENAPFTIDLSTPAQKLRAEADARAKELERKSQVLRNVQSLLSACKKIKK